MSARLNRLALRVDELPDSPDDFVVTVVVDGTAILERPGDNGRIGPYADEFSLPPPTENATRTLLATCACRNRGCEDLAALVVAQDGVVVWSDFRTFTGWDDFEGADIALAGPEDGWVADVPDLRFDRAQYEAELHRFVEDRTWWTPGYTARMIAVALHEAQERSITRDGTAQQQ